MTPFERRAVVSLASIMSLRMLGLFMILPVFSLYAHELNGATPFLIGLAAGIYGLTQGCFQLPFGMISDHVGRKTIIAMGLCFFIIGSAIAAEAHNIFIMILGRALQGIGAIGGTTMALISDLTQEDQRTKAMAINGMTIAVSFTLAMILGPALVGSIQVNGIFWLATFFGILALLILYFIVPTPTNTVALQRLSFTDFLKLCMEPQLFRLNVGVFLLHAIFTASFVIALPISLKTMLNIPADTQWSFFLPSLFAAFVFSLVMIALAEKKRLIKYYFVSAIAVLMVTELLLAFCPPSKFLAICNLLFFFTAFSLLEAFLPSLVSRTAPKQFKGTAMGIYSSSQFLGIFIGGAVGGWVYGSFGLQHVYLFCVALTLLWLGFTFDMKNPQYSTAHLKSSI